MIWSFFILIFCAIAKPHFSIRNNWNLNSFLKPKVNANERNEYSIYSMSTNDADSRQMKERDMLYEAYNSLHTLAQEFKKPFDSPAVIIVGHQSSGKSALVEALMGFQFNQVGGGTKTRRPIALQMQYNANYATPVCFLTTDSGREEQRSLEDIQAYIESENKRLERDPTRSFDAREIKIRMEYRHCPNLLIIDTPGMIQPPMGKLTVEQRAEVQAAKEVRQLVLSKIRCKDYLILCVEDTMDWKHATTRNVVAQVDPDLSRTVMVATKLDTKLPQFSAPEDVAYFLNAPNLQAQYPHRLGGPFFITVPSGRVGADRDFETNDGFVSSLQQAEASDRFHIASKLGTAGAESLMANIGVSRLRSFLEQRVEDSYRRNINGILPKLKMELEGAQVRLAAVEREMDALSLDKLASCANAYRESFAKQLQLVVQGTVKLNPAEWGEDIRAEQEKGGAFLQAPHNAELVDQVDNAMNKLYGGAQYHRALSEFRRAVMLMPSPLVSADEIANAAGMGETSNSVNFMRAACVIAMEKAEMCFDPMLDALRHRVVHIMRRLFPIVEAMVRQSYGGSGGRQMDMLSRSFTEQIRRIYDQFIELRADDVIHKCADDLHGMIKYVTWDTEDKGFGQPSGGRSAGAGQQLTSEAAGTMPITPGRMVQIYQLAVERNKRKKNSRVRTRDLLTAIPVAKQTTGSRSGGNNKKALGTSKGRYDQLLDQWKAANGAGKNSGKKRQVSAVDDDADSDDDLLVLRGLDEDEDEGTEEGALQLSASGGGGLAESEAEIEKKAMWLTEQLLATSSGATQTNAMINGIVQYIVSSWRAHFAKTVAMKFNCFYLMPFMADFPEYLRSELQKLGEDTAEMFDLGETRRNILSRRAGLQAEVASIEKMRDRFASVQAVLKHGGGGVVDGAVDGEDSDSADEGDDSQDDGGLAERTGSRQSQSAVPRRTADSVSTPKY